MNFWNFLLTLASSIIVNHYHIMHDVYVFICFKMLKLGLEIKKISVQFFCPSSPPTKAYGEILKIIFAL